MRPKEKVMAVAEKLGLTMTAEFVPFSKSRNAGEKMPSLNWRVTIYKILEPVRSDSLPQKKQTILTTDYMAGCAHCPGYKHPMDGETRNVVAQECYRMRALASGLIVKHHNAHGEILKPELTDVLYSLVSDASVIDSSGFEDWASEFGYDNDSREAEATYRACLEISLKLRNGIGEAGLAELRTAMEDY